MNALLPSTLYALKVKMEGIKDGIKLSHYLAQLQSTKLILFVTHPLKDIKALAVRKMSFKHAKLTSRYTLIVCRIETKARVRYN